MTDLQIDQLIGYYGHDFYPIDVCAELLGVSEEVVQQAIDMLGLVPGDY